MMTTFELYNNHKVNSQMLIGERPVRCRMRVETNQSRLALVRRARRAHYGIGTLA